jgi:hypothetical protein
LEPLQLRGQGNLVQDAVNAVADAEFILLRLEMDVRRAVFERFPDNLVHELDDAGLLVAFGDFLVVGDFQLHRLGFAHFIQGFGADAVVFLQGFFDV